MHRMTTKKSSIRSGIHSLSNWLFPQDCLLCQLPLIPAEINSQIPLCTECTSHLPTIETSCTICNTPLHNDSICGVCLQQQRHWDICYSAFEYRQPIDRLIHSFKYTNKPSHCRYLATLLANHIINFHDHPLPEYLIPIPMHHRRLAERGLNHSLLLTRNLSKYFDIPYRSIIKKNRHTQTQMGLNQKKRQQLIRNSFDVIENIQTDHVALVDDVMTTGTTCSEVAKILKKSGISTVEVWCLART